MYVHADEEFLTDVGSHPGDILKGGFFSSCLQVSQRFFPYLLLLLMALSFGGGKSALPVTVYQTVTTQSESPTLIFIRLIFVVVVAVSFAALPVH